MNNPERIDRIQSALRENEWDLVVCALPMNVLLFSGYWPVVGTGVVFASCDGRIGLLVPDDEKDLTKHSWANDIRTFQPGSLDKTVTPAEAICAPLRDFAKSFSRGPARIGFESQEVSEPASYAAMHLYGETMRKLLDQTFDRATLISADEVLADLRAFKTAFEISQIRTACQIAETGFRAGARRIKTGRSEPETAGAFREPLSASLAHFPGVERADGFAWCMSGANSALASKAYARSRGKRIEAGDLVLVHCNSYVDGYWTDITRTYSVGEPEERRKQMYDAVFAAREAALASLRPGAKAAEADQAARSVLQARGFGPQFTHSTGHGVGFSAISANAKPRLHPRSSDLIEPGMVFNIEPAIYFNGYGGIRHCDMVAVTETGTELLTPFHYQVGELTIDS
ncbi:MAG TPA: Xaa-Pro peptidase family protein [Bryobacteraceae bacterium]|nr:Xaa-Pro peptidase family protein [Bryobacteraceae bacterium]